MFIATSTTFGALPLDRGRTSFRVWAPHARSVAVRGQELESAGDGIWVGEAAAVPGDDYRFVLDGDAWPDPCSRWQPDGVRGRSRVLDTSALRIAPSPALSLDELVLYKLHVGNFSPAGTFVDFANETVELDA